MRELYEMCHRKFGYKYIRIWHKLKKKKFHYTRKMHVMRLVINLLFFLKFYYYYYYLFFLYDYSFKMNQMYLELGLSNFFFFFFLMKYFLIVGNVQNVDGFVFTPQTVNLLRAIFGDFSWIW